MALLVVVGLLAPWSRCARCNRWRYVSSVHLCRRCEYDVGPKPPEHFNCRCIVTPEFPEFNDPPVMLGGRCVTCRRKVATIDDECDDCRAAEARAWELDEFDSAPIDRDRE